MRMTLVTWLALGFIAAAVQGQTSTNQRPRPLNPMMTSMHVTNDLGLVTNGPAVVHLTQITQFWTNATPVQNPVVATNPYFTKMRESKFSWTNGVFDHFLPGSLNYVIWTNFLALTNGRNLRVWSERTHPEGWPTNRPSVRWNTNSVIWGLKGLTALSPCWEGEGYSGQVPFTALTRRHAYTRGHGMGPEGFQTLNAGRRVWFLTRNNVLVEAVIKRHVTRVSPGANGTHRDYTIALFDRDLPEDIEAMSVAEFKEFQTRYRTPTVATWPYPIFQTEQGGSVSTGIQPMVVNTWKPGDSGSPNMIPLPGELVFISGRSTSGPSPEMQQDLDELCRLERLNPGKYQMHHTDLTSYPQF